SSEEKYRLVEEAKRVWCAQWESERNHLLAELDRLRASLTSLLQDPQSSENEKLQLGVAPPNSLIRIREFRCATPQFSCSGEGVSPLRIRRHPLAKVNHIETQD